MSMYSYCGGELSAGKAQWIGTQLQLCLQNCFLQFGIRVSPRKSELTLPVHFTSLPRSMLHKDLDFCFQVKMYKGSMIPLKLMFTSLLNALTQVYCVTFTKADPLSQTDSNLNPGFTT